MVYVSLWCGFGQCATGLNLACQTGGLHPIEAVAGSVHALDAGKTDGRKNRCSKRDQRRRAKGPQNKKRDTKCFGHARYEELTAVESLFVQKFVCVYGYSVKKYRVKVMGRT